MRPKFRLIMLTAFILASVHLAQAQQTAKIPRVGWLAAGSPSGVAPLTDAFRQGLRQLGYVERKNIVIEFRYAEGKFDRLPDLAAEIVRLKVDVIVVASTPAIRAVKQATATIPIVMVGPGDPVGLGLIASLARPGGNLTGLSFLSTELTGKRLELLKEAFPKISRVAVLQTTGSAQEQAVKESEVAAQALRIQVQPVQVQRPDDFENAFVTITKGRAGALLILRSPLVRTHATRIMEFAEKRRLPTMYDDRLFVDAGGLMSYGTNTLDFYSRAAVYVDKILKGAKPADLPVEQPMRFELIINLRAAKKIGVTVPPNVLARADKVIR
jgi:putative tryptophan/tyrosine transport system substrate-binding protein